MLHRAARNAYSWWWASHIRTKQSKWLDQNMHDMEEKVEYILKIINEGGDSFAVRAEMYYRKRPELVNFVEDCFRNYRALAERYDHLSRDFQSANRTIATVFPERVQMAMEVDEEKFSASSSKFFEEAKQSSFEDLPAAPPELMSIPRMVSIIKRNSKTPSRMMSRKGLLKMNGVDDLMASKSSGLTKEEALREIDKLQKDILGLQTEKEFVKSLYENGLSKYWDIEKQVTEMQASVSSLEDEFGIGTVIKDDEARSLMASTALKSCKDTLVKLQAKQEQMADEARVEHWRVKEVREKFEALIAQLRNNQTLLKEPKSPNPSLGLSNQTVHREHNFPNPSQGPISLREHKSPYPSPDPSNKTVPKERKSSDPNPGLSNQTDPKEQNSPYPCPDSSNETVPREQKSPDPNPSLSNHTDHKEEKYPYPSPDPSNQNVPREQKSPDPNPSPSNQMDPKEHKSPYPNPDPSNQTVPIEQESPYPNPSLSHQTDPKEHHSPNQSPGPSNQTVSREQKSPNPSLSPSNQMLPREHKSPNPSPGSSPDLEGSVGKEGNDMELLRAKIKDQLTNGETAHTVSELVENIDELVDKVINLETEVNSQSALVKRFKSEANQLQEHLWSLEEGKEGLIGDSKKKSKKISELEEELCRVQSLNNTVRDQNKNLEACFIEASCTLDALSEKLPNAKPEEEAETGVFKEERAVPGVNLEKRIQAHEDMAYPNNVLEISKGVKTKEGADRPPIVPEADLPHKGQVRAVLDVIQEQRFKESGTGNEEMKKRHFADHRASAKSQLNGHSVQGEVMAKAEKKLEKKGDEDKSNKEKEKKEHNVHQNQSNQQDELSARNREPKNQDRLHTVGSDANEVGTDEDQPNWRELFLNGLDDRERTLVEEYTSLLGDYKQVKKKLTEVENKNRASLFRSIVQIKVLKSANASKDAEIKSLHRKLNLFITSPDETFDSHESASIRSSDETLNTHESTSKTSTDENPNTHESTSTTSTDENPNTHESAGNAALQISPTSIPKSNKKRVRFLIGNVLVEQDVEPMEKTDKSTSEKCMEISPTEEGKDDNKGISASDEPHTIPTIEEKIRMDIDDLLEENIEFWLRFSTSVHQIKKIEIQFHDLQDELTKAMEKRKRDESTTPRSSDSDARAIYKHMREIETELTLWMEHNGVLRDDLQNRLLSLSTIQEEITRLYDSASQVDQSELTDYQAAKFQGEVMNMKQENNKVASELLAGLDRGKRLKVDIDKTTEMLDEEFGISIAKNPQMKNSGPRAKIPLRSFLFGVKLKKQKPSLFACISPQLQRQYSDLSGLPI